MKPIFKQINTPEQVIISGLHVPGDEPCGRISALLVEFFCDL
jgi:hypothetical protein